MGMVNRFPRGLLGLLEAKTTGETPSETENKLQLGVDIGPYYLSTVALRYATAQTASNAIDDQVGTVEIPAGETWQVIGVTTEILFNNNNDVAIALPTIVAPKNDGVQVLGTEESIGIANHDAVNLLMGPNETRSIAMQFPYPLICKAPIKFATRIERIGTVGVINFRTFVYYYQLD